jgi:hypothetical protein
MVVGSMDEVLRRSRPLDAVKHNAPRVLVCYEPQGLGKVSIAGDDERDIEGTLLRQANKVKDEESVNTLLNRSRTLGLLIRRAVTTAEAH